MLDTYVEKEGADLSIYSSSHVISDGTQIIQLYRSLFQVVLFHDGHKNGDFISVGGL